MTPEPTAAGQPVLLTTKQMAKRLGMPESGLRNRIRRGNIPFYRLGGRIRFDPDEVLAYGKACGSGRSVVQCKPPKRRPRS